MKALATFIIVFLIPVAAQAIEMPRERNEIKVKATDLVEEPRTQYDCKLEGYGDSLISRVLSSYATVKVIAHNLQEAAKLAVVQNMVKEPSTDRKDVVEIKVEGQTYFVQKVTCQTLATVKR